MSDSLVSISTTKKNRAADNLSRLKIQLFKEEAGELMDKWPTALPENSWPASQIWEPLDK